MASSVVKTTEYGIRRPDGKILPCPDTDPNLILEALMDGEAMMERTVIIERGPWTESQDG